MENGQGVYEDTTADTSRPIHDDTRHDATFVDDPMQPTATQDSDTADNPGTNVFVANISKRATDSDLRELFSQFGHVETWHRMMDPTTGIPRGFGFVTYTDPNDAHRAIAELNGRDVSGLPLKVELVSSFLVVVVFYLICYFFRENVRDQGHRLLDNIMVHPNHQECIVYRLGWIDEEEVCSIDMIRIPDHDPLCVGILQEDEVLPFLTITLAVPLDACIPHDTKTRITIVVEDTMILSEVVLPHPTMITVKDLAEEVTTLLLLYHPPCVHTKVMCMIVVNQE